MIYKSISLLFIALILFGFVQAQTPQDTTAVSVNLKDGSVYKGQLISESSDSITIKMKGLGPVSIAKNEILNENLVSIETDDGNEFLGEIVKEDEKVIVLKTQNFGEITIYKNKIKTRKKVESHQIKQGKLWFDNPQSTRYLWAPNGYGLKKGEGYYQNIWVLWNQVTYGITNNFSVGGGVIPLFLFGGAPTPVFITAKVSVPIVKNKINVGGGVIAGTILGESEGFGILYGLSTFGTPDNNVSVGLGYGFSGEEWASSPMINVNGMFRITSRGYIITENYYINMDGERAAFLSLGGRWIIKKAALDYGLIFPIIEGSEFIAFPWLGFTIPFGKTD